MSENTISRKDFLKKTGLGALAVVLAGKSIGMQTVSAATSDNVGGGGASGTHIGPVAPSDTKMMWVDTSDEGTMKYHNGTKWTNIRSAWDE